MRETGFWGPDPPSLLFEFSEKESMKTSIFKEGLDNLKGVGIAK